MERRRLQTIVNLALPIIGGMISQNILNLVDTAMVGVLGPSALAAVGVASYANFMAMAIVMGLSSGVQAMTARRVGESRTAETAVPLNGGLLLAVLIGLAISLVLFPLAPQLFPFLNRDSAVVAEGVPYLQARLLAIVAVGMNFAFRGYWTGVSMTRLYLRTLLIMHSTNIVLNYILIFGKFGLPALGTLGAGLGTTIATYIGTAFYVVFALRLARGQGFLHHVPNRQTMTAMLRLSVPSAVQQFLFATGITAFFWIIGQVGTAEVAASNVLVNLLLVAILPSIGLGLAALSLVSEALGRGDATDARRWGWQVAAVACVSMTMIGLPAVIMPQVLLAGFIHDPAVLNIGIAPLRLAGATIMIDGIATILMNALLGAGAARQVMMVAVGSQWLLGLPLAWFVGPYLGFGLLSMWLAWFGYRAVQSVVFTCLWVRGNWATIKV
ncbi:MAG: MATE family efflux transporter [Acidiferrobacterales bacterium]